ncbi:MAG TPA: carboxylesterase family protein [Terriglobia bacterium]|jgi:para-nitrobenzyl esterase
MRRITLMIIGCLLLGAQIGSAAIPDPVKTDYGLVSGTNGTSPGIRAFKGIPFAAPPLGPLRWQPPQPPAAWNGVRKADQFGPRCLQAAPRAQGGAPAPAVSEDCLYLNVWTGAKSAAERRPVIVFAYGGGFNTGAGSEPRYDGEALAKKGVVFVTFNYRLGMLGFFAHPELTEESNRKASGNYAFMDFISVLKWVQRNIENFGGDPKRVTIMGESAGAMMVAAMVGSPEVTGLFQRAIAESGAWMGLGVGHMAELGPAEAAGKKLGTLADLRNKPADELMRLGRGSGIIVDGWIIPEDLSITFTQGRQNDVDVLVGSNQDEGTFFAGGQRGGGAGGGNGAAQQLKDQAQQRFGKGDMMDSFLQLYPANSDAEAAASSLTRVRDEMAWHMRTWAKLQSKRGKGKAYWYYFTRVPPVAPGQPSRGATHTAELAYVFNNLQTATNPWTDTDRSLADTLSSYWANFAANGDPNGKGLPAWPAFKDKTIERAMILGDKVEPGAPLDSGRVAFYDAAYDGLFRIPEKKPRRP